MNARRFLHCIAALGLAGALGACQQSNTDDPVAEPVAGPNSFLLFPNPGAPQPGGGFQTDTSAYAQAYYAAIDPLNEKDTLTKWRNANGFGTGGTEVTVVFGDTRDLGYGRRMTFRRNVNGTIAAMVENYLVYSVADYTYSSLNLDAAVARDQRWHVGTNGIEFSPAPNGQTFAKFFTFDPVTGQRLLEASLDGRGKKAMPGICINCHGGRADPLTATGGFPREGNTRARLQPLHVESFGFSSAAGFTRADQEDKLKTINQLVLCTYSLPFGTVKPTGFPEDDCRAVAGADEWFAQWQSTAAEMVKDWYRGNAMSGNGMPSAAFSDTYVPAGWVGQETLYNGVVAPYCRVCHVLRGTSNQSDVDFTSYAKFESYADRIKAHVFDRGNMPLAKIINQRFWSSNGPELLATFLDNHGHNVRDGAGAVLRPGRPIADPGPDRTTTVPVTLSGTNSLFASTYTWSIVSKEPGSSPSLANANSASPVFNTNINGTYVLQLVVGNGSASSSPEQLTLTVNSGLSPAPSAVRFSDIRGILQSPLTGCFGCHTDLQSTGPSGVPPWEPLAYTPPIFYTDYDRGGTTSVGTPGDGSYTADSTDDDYWFYLELRGRVNFTDTVASPLLRKPTNHHHYGGLVFDFNNTSPCAAPCAGFATLGDWYRAQYNTIVNWIANNAPY
jgi:hypothetical protein